MERVEEAPPVFHPLPLGPELRIYAERGGDSQEGRWGEPSLPAGLAALPGIQLTSIALSSLAVQGNKPVVSWSFPCVMTISTLAASHGGTTSCCCCSPGCAHLEQHRALQPRGFCRAGWARCGCRVCFWGAQTVQVILVQCWWCWWRKVPFHSSVPMQPFLFSRRLSNTSSLHVEKYNGNKENGYWKFSLLFQHYFDCGISLDPVVLLSVLCPSPFFTWVKASGF